MGLMATILPGVRPSILFGFFAPRPSTSPVFLLMATMEGSLTTMPLARAPYTNVVGGPQVNGKGPLEKNTEQRSQVVQAASKNGIRLDDIRDLALSKPLSLPGRTRLLLRGWGAVVHNSMGKNPVFAVKPKSPVPREIRSRGGADATGLRSSFCHRIHPALGILARVIVTRLSPGGKSGGA